eukprot:gene29073-36146_t
MKFHSKGQAMYKYFKNTSEWNADPDPRWFVGIWVTGKFLGVVSPEGKPLEYPPLHNHHTHLRKLSNFILLDPPSSGNPDVPPTRVEQDVSEMAGLFWESHADSACDSRARELSQDFYCLRETCEIKSTGVDLVEQCTSALPSNHSARMLREVPELTECPPKPMQIICRLGLIDTPTDKSTVLWWTVTLPRDGRLIEANLHVHQRFFHSFLLLSGTPDDDPGREDPNPYPWFSPI